MLKNDILVEHRDQRCHIFQRKPCVSNFNTGAEFIKYEWKSQDNMFKSYGIVIITPSGIRK